MRADPSLVRFRTVVQSALAALEERRQEVDDLNVFPVADGDTGRNMVNTLQAVLDELTRLEAQGGPIDSIGREEIVHAVSRAALLGARGNSGVILSQLIRGAAEELVSRPGELVDPVLVAAAMANDAHHAYTSVNQPAEGTSLTVTREMAHRLASELAHMPEGVRRLEQRDMPRQDEVLADVIERALETGQDSLKRGKDLLPALKEAGVVDAGAYGLLIIFNGVLAALRGEEPPPLEHHHAARLTHPEHESSTHRFCTNFAVTGQALGEPAPWVRKLERIGDSVLVVGDERTLKVHVHTDEPEAATALFAEHGSISHLDVADMHEQVAERASRLAVVSEATCGVLAVVSGTGMAELFRSLGATPLDGGPTLNPSTYELLAGIHSVAAEEVVVLPNSPNVIMAAERAAELSEKVVHVVASRSQQAGLAAAVALEATHGAEPNAAAMRSALEHVRTGAVAEAARDDGESRFRRGDSVGFVEDRLVAWGTDPGETLRAVLEQLASEAELVTCIAGDGAPLGPDEVELLAPGGVELELSYGGQPSYWWLLAAE